MANMTRDEMRDELKAHGWSRFTDAQLVRYLDWGLQEVYSEGDFQRVAYVSTIRDDKTSPVVSFEELSGSSDPELVQQIRRVWIEDPDETNTYTLLPADREFFWNVMRHQGGPDATTGKPTYYFVWDLMIHIYPGQTSAKRVGVDWLRRKDSFASGSDTSGLPQRFDKVVITWAEVFCHKRARELQEMVNAERQARDLLLREMGMEGMTMYEEHSRVTPWGG